LGDNCLDDKHMGDFATAMAWQVEELARRCVEHLSEYFLSLSYFFLFIIFLITKPKKKKKN
jgi:hypothetical protein